MRRKSNGYELDVQGIDIHVDLPESEKFRVASTQIFGIIKYCKPIDSEVIYAFKSALFQLGESGELDRKKLSAFAQLTNSDWLPFVNRYSRLFKLQSRLSRLSGLLSKALSH
jgi:hypothetical protein